MTTDNGGLRGMLAAVQELKAEYGIGSLDAWKYLKIQQDYRRLSDEIAAELAKGGITHRPSLREISHLCSLSMRYTSNAFAIIAEELQTGGKPWQENVNNVVPNNVVPYSVHDRVPDPDYGNEWTFDYQHFLITFYPLYVQLKDLNEAFRQAFLDFYEGEYPYLTSPNGEKTSFADLKKDDSVFLDKRHVYDLDEMHGEEADEIRGRMKERRDEFIGKLAGTVPFYFPMGATDEEMWLLMGSGSQMENLYQRAEKEHTLGNLFVERRIALNHLTTWGLASKDVAAGFDFLIQELREREDYRREQVEKLILEGGPEVMIKGNKKLYRMNRYTRLSLIKNRQWLLKFLWAAEEDTV